MSKKNPLKSLYALTWERLFVLIEQHQLIVAFGIAILSSAILLPSPFGSVQGDVGLYEGVARDLSNGRLPYRDRVLEYPPYAIPLFILPRIFSEELYPNIFIWLMFVVDWLIKLDLVRLSAQITGGLARFVPIAAYCFAIPFLRSFILQRYDLVPAAICYFAIRQFCASRQGIAGFLIALGIGVKVYPMLFVPPLFILARRQCRGRSFLAGIVGGLLPMLLLSFALPWWRFAQFHSDRGLQCESFYASIIWAAKRANFAEAKWSFVRAWSEVSGPLAAALLPWARGLFAAAVLISVGLACCAAAKLKGGTISALSRILLLPLLAFVAFNQVLSPQYMAWLLPLAVLGSIERGRLQLLILVVAIVLTPIFFPSFFGDYGTGLSLLETIVLVIRNILLVTAWGLLARELISVIRDKEGLGRSGLKKSQLLGTITLPLPGHIN